MQEKNTNPNPNEIPLTQENVNTVKQPQDIIEKPKTDLKFRLPFSDKQKKILKFVLIGLGAFVALLLVLVGIQKMLSAFKINNKQNEPVSTATSKSVEFPYDEEIRNPSVYATDEAILKLSEDTSNLDKLLDSVDINQSHLNIPDIKFDINFETK